MAGRTEATVDPLSVPAAPGLNTDDSLCIHKVVTTQEDCPWCKVEELELELALARLRLIAADAMADAVEATVERGALDARSAIADALLDYREPFSATSIATRLRAAELAAEGEDGELGRLRAMLERMGICPTCGSDPENYADKCQDPRHPCACGAPARLHHRGRCPVRAVSGHLRVEISTPPSLAGHLACPVAADLWEH